MGRDWLGSPRYVRPSLGVWILGKARKTRIRESLMTGPQQAAGPSLERARPPAPTMEKMVHSFPSLGFCFLGSRGHDIQVLVTMSKGAVSPCRSGHPSPVPTSAEAPQSSVAL